MIELEPADMQDMKDTLNEVLVEMGLRTGGQNCF
nr:MAG: hypothetical protein [Bacteriophage sp.]